jgi:hypothetical protein
MNNLIENAKEELKRIDHLIYVTLKYTRTVDVFLSIIERMINAYEFIVDALLEDLKKEETIKDIPEIPVGKAELVSQHIKTKKIKEHITKYLLFRKLRRAPYDKDNEFRRHVTMTAEVNSNIVKVTIDSITEDFQSLKAFIEYLEKYFEK